MFALLALLAGYKTYAVAILALAGILGAFLSGSMSAGEAIGAAFVAVQTMNIRSGITTEAAKAAAAAPDRG